MSPRWWMPALLAIQFLTRIPVPGLSRLRADEVSAGLVRAVSWFPLAGGLVGAISTGVLVLTDSLWPRAVAVVLTLMIEARLTGAFHEDAVADFCDGFGGGQTPARIHEIMKDSRVGAYGTVGLVLAIALRGALLAVLPIGLLAPALIASAAFGRWLAVVPKALLGSPPGVDGLAAAIVAGTGPRQLVVASLVVIPFVLPIAWLRPEAFGLALLGTAAFMVWFCRFLVRRLGGVTGDCLGFAVYAGQLIVLLSLTATWPAALAG